MGPSPSYCFAPICAPGLCLCLCLMLLLANDPAMLASSSRVYDGKQASDHQQQLPHQQQQQQQRYHQGRVLSRHRRFLTFPQGSSFSASVCLTTGVIGNPNVNYLSMGLNWGIAYDLPNATWIQEHAKEFGKLRDGDEAIETTAMPIIQRRHRRHLYNKMELLISRIGEPTEAQRANVSATKGAELHARWRRALSRPKRYLAFPEGSSFTVSVCFTVGIIGNPRYNYMAFGLNWGVAYDLPNTSWVLNHLHGFAAQPYPVSALRRRTRRSLYGHIQTIVNNMGYNGRDCILRALCESRQYFRRTKMSMLGEMLRVIFSLPKQRVFKRELDEQPDIEVYDRAYRSAAPAGIDCGAQYECSFSLLELAFGKYATPPPDYFQQPNFN